MAIKFILNDKIINTDLPESMTLLDFIRYQQHLTGTKIGCREGDCGACTVLIGELKNNNNNDQLTYRSVTSCLTPLGNAHAKHIVTIEGINLPQQNLNPIQQVMLDENASQCGFCSPGFIMSLAGFCLSSKMPTAQNAIAAIDGNICRCTGYKSIERAAVKVADILQNKKATAKPDDPDEPSVFVAQNNLLPPYFAHVKDKLIALLDGKTANDSQNNDNPIGKTTDAGTNKDSYFVGGGTDLYVQKHDQIQHAPLHVLFDKAALNGIVQEGKQCLIGGATTVADIAESELMNQIFPQLPRFVKLVSSTPIRNMATIAGNLANASPIGDFTVFFLALNAQIILRKKNQTRQIPLRQFYKGYKILAKDTDEIIEKIGFDIPNPNTSFFNFEKVSKRTHLDIASVNSALYICTSGDNVITEAGLSAGGVAPVPAFLVGASAFLRGKPVSPQTILEAIEQAQKEIQPISDVRGSSEYKRLLLGQLIKAHFLTLFPNYLSPESLLFA